jgi:hypothetical protein
MPRPRAGLRRVREPKGQGRVPLSRERRDRRRSLAAGIVPGGANVQEDRVEGILKFFGSVVGIIFLIGLVVVVGLLMLIF